jgi:hypothetical protein
MHCAIDRIPPRAARRTVAALGLAAWALGTMLAASAAMVDGSNAAGAQARYQEERAACMRDDRGPEIRANCLKEAGAVLQATRRGTNADGPVSYEQNQRVRCDRLPADDREDCLRRMRGEGDVSGSVQGGGIFREIRTTTPAPR